MGITQIAQGVNNSQTTPWKKIKNLLICKGERSYLLFHSKNQTPLTSKKKKKKKEAEDVFVFLLKNPP